ncbi:MAG TPA: polyprenol monophosphomannose synthase [Candidatus Syntrophosphaera sp.]|uniref:Polyprenol monophosphomannose synthase n=1 Tax=Candidatus Syntrophosphaera thermopropionivorans TaxID=2593015 RepID=A0AC61QL01_9BACT|nr:polyprenol monophosphomannose synthase [Candidatus Syntrophosphaera thermopropionivorans]MBP9006459.1 polyprenol monophosphomannose synthase [Candidatus Syntrophosphaera sp.]TDF74602.1 polyprenol monophosphomannose synthase [Candidatus Syntrophosphaera thermopropionivorans]HNZ44618.1 polyprenol monophosphomannose synthase [Candidatus Syntrophosphaera thermopropionivorans]HOH82684.1 polyprenol monophosphomannose synthase [Candidatus Syntrophosphaera thermopropionivorans]HOL33026.1 polyprenol
MKALLIIPTYNEIANIKNIITASLSQSPDLYILVIDDNSPDGTAKAVKEMMENEPHINLIERPKKMGLGSAYVQGFKYALNNDYDYVLEMDADFSHNPADIPRLLEAAKKYDVVIGSRYCQGVNIINWPFRRLLISYFASKYVRIITGMPIKDPTSGFKCFRRRVLEAIDLDSILSDGYAFQIEMNFRAWVKGFTIYEIPIVFTERRDGVSKMSRQIVWEAAWMVWRLQIMKLLGKIK